MEQSELRTLTTAERILGHSEEELERLIAHIRVHWIPGGKDSDMFHQRADYMQLVLDNLRQKQQLAAERIRMDHEHKISKLSAYTALVGALAAWAAVFLRPCHNGNNKIAATPPPLRQQTTTSTPATTSATPAGVTLEPQVKQ